jgi:hypothetical protein
MLTTDVGIYRTGAQVFLPSRHSCPHHSALWRNAVYRSKSCNCARDRSQCNCPLRRATVNGPLQAFHFNDQTLWNLWRWGNEWAVASYEIPRVGTANVAKCPQKFNILKEMFVKSNCNIRLIGSWVRNLTEVKYRPMCSCLPQFSWFCDRPISHPRSPAEYIKVKKSTFAPVI